VFQNFKILSGYDNRGVVYDNSEHILREINSEFLNYTLEVYNLYKKFELYKYNIVQTEHVFLNNKNFLKHEKYTISYPCEWSANMFKNAVVLHLELFLKLDEYGLTLKDAMPNNIVFDFTKPVFIDFLSILKIEDLKYENWFSSITNASNNISRVTVFEKMFFSFILIPFVLFGRKNYMQAREMLSDRACNVIGCKMPTWHDLFIKSKNQSLFNIYLENFKIYKIYKFKSKNKFLNFCKKNLEFVKSINVTPNKSDYLLYYENKKENFSFQDYDSWKNKQKNVFKILKNLKPKTVLDLGANSGWFSILAEKNGSQVISTDIDESCVDDLYIYSKKNNLNILSLLLSFKDLSKQIYGIENKVLFLKAQDRFQSDLVLCLALFHHLTLGEGMGIDKIFEILSILSLKTLVLEFINLEDNLIKNEPTFFKNLNKYSTVEYNLDNVIKIGLKFFKSFDVLDSHPDTRKLIVFNK